MFYFASAYHFSILLDLYAGLIFLWVETQRMEILIKLFSVGVFWHRFIWFQNLKKIEAKVISLLLKLVSSR